MSFYTAHYRNRPGQPDLVLVKEGFSWAAFIFGALWALWNRLWIVAAGLIAVEIGLGLVLAALGMGSEIQAVASIGLALLVGLIAGDLKRWSLSVFSGYDQEGVVAGSRLQEAESRLLAQRPDLRIEFV